MNHILSLKKAKLALFAMAGVTLGLVSGAVTAKAATPDECFVFSGGTISDYNDTYTPSGGAATPCPNDVEVPSEIGGNEVTTIGNQAFFDGVLTSVIIPHSVTTIGDQAFSNNSLTSVTIPDSVTHIGKYAFFLNSLTSVIISNSVTVIDEYVFSGNSLTSVIIPNSVTSIGENAFYSNSLTSVTVSNSVTSIASGAFSGNSLMSVDIPNSVTSIDDEAFLENSANGAAPYALVTLKVADNNPHGLSAYDGGVSEGGHTIVAVAPAPEPEPEKESTSSSSSGGTRFGCKDVKASNFRNFVAHKQSLCEYNSVGTLNAPASPTTAMSDAKKQELIKVLRQIIILLTAKQSLNK